ncbi:MAG: hypothetical protein ACYC92_14065 [Candidatus Acidiferrales bacterium]
MIFRIRHSLILSCFMVGACILFFCPLRASARLNGYAITVARQKSSADAVKFHEQSIGKISGGSEFKDLQASNGYVTWVEQNGSTSKWVVYRDGEQIGRKYDGVKYLEFSPDGEHLAFFGERDSSWLLVLDGRESSSQYKDVTPVAFQPHGPSWAFSACYAENTCAMIVRGHPAVMPRETYDQVSPPQFSLDGKRLGFMVQFHGKWTAIVDGKALGPPVDAYSCLGFSPDAAHFFACGRRKKLGWTYFIDGVPGPYFAQLGPIVFSNDAKHYLYGGSGMQFGFAKNRTTGAIVLDGKEGKAFQGSGMRGEWTVLLDASMIAGEAYGAGFVVPVLFSPGYFISGPRILSANLNGVSDPAFGQDGDPVYAARLGQNDVVVFDGAKPGLRFDDVVSDIVFTDDGLHSAYVALRSKKFVEVLDGQPRKGISLKDLSSSSHGRKPAPADLNSTPGINGPAPPPKPKAFSIGWTELTPHATHFAFEIIEGGTRFKNGRTLRARRTVVLDGNPGKQYNAIGISVMQFSDNGRHYWYTVSGVAGKKGLVVADGRESKLYNNLTEAQFVAANNAIMFFARKGSHILRITIPLPADSATGK